MKKNVILLSSFFMFIVFDTQARIGVLNKDTTIMMNEVVVTGSPKQTIGLGEMPASVSLLGIKAIESQNINSLKDLQSHIPNFFIPDYGSKITSSIFVRGIGSRSGEPAVAMYVDNVPYLDRSAFDFDFFDIQRVEVVRGPQGTLYGRNAMGGLVNIHTLSPLKYQGTRVSVLYGNENTLNYKLSHYAKFSNTLGLSAGAYYKSTDGFFTNQFNNKSADDSKSAGGRARLEWQLSNRLKLDYSVNFDYTRQGGYPYALLNADGSSKPVNYNDDCSYFRRMANTGLSLTYVGDGFQIASISGYQYLNDRLNLDQDFTKDARFTLSQNQFQHAFTQEIVAKSTSKSDYKWIFGAFGFYKDLYTDSPVTIKKAQIDSIQKTLTGYGINITSTEMPIPGIFKSPSLGVAIYHQSEYKVNKALSVTAGLRLDYEKNKLDYNTESTMNVGPPFASVTAKFTGVESQDYLQLLPKIALKYEVNKQYNVYASVSKGYKTGGYNFQMFADLISTVQKNKLYNQGPGPKFPVENNLDVAKYISYKPEQSWNYEIGTRSEILKNRFFVDASAFYIDSRDLQFVVFSPSGQGRMMKNAGRSESMGLEVSTHIKLMDDLNLQVCYGYTLAKFKDYTDTVIMTSKNYAKYTLQSYETVVVPLNPVPGQVYLKQDFKNHYLPMAPQHTLSVIADYTLKLQKNSMLDRVIFRAQYNGAGRIYWTEKNQEAASQSYYSLLNGSVGLVRKKVQLDFWAKNVLNTDYNAFYFESFGNKIVQKGRPIQFGVKLNWAF